MKNYKIILPVLAIIVILVGCKKDKVETHNPAAPVTIDKISDTSGSAGTQILITGNNFSSDTSQIQVTINGSRLRVLAANIHQIMAVVPKKSGSGPVVVSINGQSANSEAVFQYIFTRTVTTLAGSGKAGFVNGMGTDAWFNIGGQSWYRSSGIAVDDNLNVYVADVGNHCIRKINPEGMVTLLSGNPTAGGRNDGQGTDANFEIPYSICTDSQGNIWSVDPGVPSLRMTTPEGVTTSIADTRLEAWAVAYDHKTNSIYYTGANTPASVYRYAIDGSFHDAVITGLTGPGAITFDKDGNLYVTGAAEHVVRKFKANTWEPEIIAGVVGQSGFENGDGAQAKFASPWGIAALPTGELVVAGNGSWDGCTCNADQSVRLLSPTVKGWTVSTFAGSNAAGFIDGMGSAAGFSAPIGVAVDKEGAVYVLDKNNNSVRKIVSE